MTHILKTAIACTVGGTIGVIVGYQAFVWGFNRGAVKYAPIIQKDTTALVCGLRYTEPIRCELQYTQSVQSTFNPMNQ